PAPSPGEEAEPVLPVPPMRVAGVHTGSIVAAILEVNGQTIPAVVPGSTFQVPGSGDQFRVDRIERDKVMISREVPGYTKRQVVQVGMEGGPTGPIGGPMPGMGPMGGMSGGPMGPRPGMSGGMSGGGGKRMGGGGAGF